MQFSVIPSKSFFSGESVETLFHCRGGGLTSVQEIQSAYFVIVAGVLQGDTLAPYLFIICLDCVLRTSIDKIRENGFKLTKKRSRRYPAKTITDADYADDIALLANTPNQAETLLHSLERAAAGISLHVNAHKIEYMCYNQNRRHFHTRWILSETGRQIHLPRKQCLSNWKRHWHTANEGIDSYQ